MANLSDLLGGAVSNVEDVETVTSSSSDPAVDSNPSATGHIWINTTSGEVYICTDITSGSNVWTNMGDGGGAVKPLAFYGDRVIAFSVGNAPQSIDYWNITSTGNASDFGDNLHTNTAVVGGACSDGSRGVKSEYYAGSSSYSMEFVTISTLGNASSFGNATLGRSAGASSNGVRGLFAGGATSGGSTKSDIIDYITIATTGDATDFGDLSEIKNNPISISNKDRAVFSGGNRYPTTPTNVNTMEYVNPSSTGDATDFGDLLYIQYNGGGVSGDTRGIICGGYSPSDASYLLNTLQYFTIASTGNATDFGDLLFKTGEADATNNSTRGVIAGGNSPTWSTINQIQYITIASTGNATDFGDLTEATTNLSMCSGD